MKPRHLSILAVALMTIVSCDDQNHFITDRGYRDAVEEDFAERMEMFGGEANEVVANVFETVGKAENDTEREALEFLYAYMPLGDVADYDGSLWLDGVRTAFMAKREMPWGREIPEEVFRHFVLPLRVNNENLDGARTVFYKELKDRVAGMGMKEAVLEVNHWCHEKVNYSPSDVRTSAPLATMKTSWGRCGEESVFAVAAFRSVGIPARQVYTPRWAHTDDNHAWVEVWVDGVWHYLGACEPEPELDVAWFTTTAKRGVLMHTKAFGRYEDEDADIIDRTACYTELNVTSNYVPVSRVKVEVVDTNLRPVSGAGTEFCIYNYAEFYPAIKTVTDGDGIAEATFGCGDILVWASKGGLFGYRKVTPGKDPGEKKGFFRALFSSGATKGVYRIVLNHRAGDAFSDTLNIVPPPPVKVKNTLSPEAVAENAVRMAHEDSLRNAYVATFPSGDKYTVAACGNWEEIESFIFLNSSSPERQKTAERMLDLMNAKDLRDTPCDILMNHILGYHAHCDLKTPQSDYVLNPRIANEMLVPYMKVFPRMFGDSLSVADILSVAGKIKVADRENPASIPVSPIGVARLGMADSRSRDIFFVAMCRVYGVPARMDPVDGDPQYWQDGVWKDAGFDAADDCDTDADAVSQPKGRVVLTYNSQPPLDDPRYEIHFTISRIDNGTPVLMNFTDKEGMEGSCTWKNIFRDGVSIEAGTYLLTTGVRMASGEVLSSISVFNVPERGSVSVPLVLRQHKNEPQVIGSMNAESEFTLLKPAADTSEGKRVSILETTGRGYFVLCFVKSSNEPSNHSMQSLLSDAPRFPAILLFSSKEDFSKVNWELFPSFPANVFCGIDDGIMDAVCTELKITEPQMPLVVIADTFGRIVNVSQGYNIGLADQLKQL